MTEQTTAQKQIADIAGVDAESQVKNTSATSRMPEKYKKALEGLDAAAKEARDDEIISVYEGFDKSKFLEQSARRLPLPLFEEHFLRFFKNEIKDNAEKENRLSAWLSVAGHVGCPVDIFDPVTENILFTIPALRDGNLLDPDKAEALSYALRQYGHHAARSPRSAISYLINNKDLIAKNLVVDDIEEKKRKLWDGFNNYYKNRKSTSSQTAKEERPDDSGDPEDLFNFG